MGWASAPPPGCWLNVFCKPDTRIQESLRIRSGMVCSIYVRTPSAIGTVALDMFRSGPRLPVICVAEVEWSTLGDRVTAPCAWHWLPGDEACPPCALDPVVVSVPALGGGASGACGLELAVRTLALAWWCEVGARCAWRPSLGHVPHPLCCAHHASMRVSQPSGLPAACARLLHSSAVTLSVTMLSAVVWSAWVGKVRMSHTLGAWRWASALAVAHAAVVMARMCSGWSWVSGDPRATARAS